MQRFHTAVHRVFKPESMAEREIWWKAFFENDDISEATMISLRCLINLVSLS